jgi:hypothetical protein
LPAVQTAVQAPQPMQACNSGISRNISSLLRRLLRSMSIARGLEMVYPKLIAAIC